MAKDVSLFAFVIDFGAVGLGPGIPEIRLSGPPLLHYKN